jgi:hypothetical protein
MSQGPIIHPREVGQATTSPESSRSLQTTFQVSNFAVKLLERASSAEECSAG